MLHVFTGCCAHAYRISPHGARLHFLCLCIEASCLCCMHSHAVLMHTGSVPMLHAFTCYAYTYRLRPRGLSPCAAHIHLAVLAHTGLLHMLHACNCCAHAGLLVACPLCRWRRCQWRWTLRAVTLRPLAVSSLTYGVNCRQFCPWRYARWRLCLPVAVS